MINGGNQKGMIGIKMLYDTLYTPLFFFFFTY